MFDQDSRRFDDVNLTVVPALGGLMVAHLNEEGNVFTGVGKAPSGAITIARHVVQYRSGRMWSEDDDCRSNGCMAYSLKDGQFEADSPNTRLVYARSGA